MSDEICKKCHKKIIDCICDLSSYTKIGKDVSACEFLDTYATNNGSIFFQGWVYKHNQMKFKLLGKDNEIQKLQAENEKLRKCVEFYANTLSWQHIPCETRHNWFRPIISPEQDCSQVNTDEWCSYGGKLARQTLKELKRGKDE